MKQLGKSLFFRSRAAHETPRPRSKRGLLGEAHPRHPYTYESGHRRLLVDSQRNPLTALA
jgi:hypothetical protein